MVELGSEFLCAHLALTPEPRADHASYVETWLRVLRNDNLYRRRRQQLADMPCDAERGGVISILRAE